jgi:2-dehydro-3-deoxygluconokinase
MDILAIGEPLLEFSERREEATYLSGFGGDTSNFSISVARQGGNIGYLTRVGADAFGNQFLELWKQENVDTTFVTQTPEAHTGMYFITYENGNHQFTYFRKNSAASQLTPTDVPESIFSQLKMLFLSGITQAISNSSCDTTFYAIELAKKHHVTIAYDPNLRLKLWSLARAKAIIEATAIQTDIFLPSLEDAVQLTGLESPDAIIDYYLTKGVKQIVLKLGAQGAVVANASDRQHIPAFPVDPVDTTGAGDTFDGALIAKVVEGQSLTTATQYANAAAALSTAGYGAVIPIPTKEQVERFLAQFSD